MRVIYIWSEGYREPRNDVGYLSPADRLVGFNLEPSWTFSFSQENTSDGVVFVVNIRKKFLTEHLWEAASANCSDVLIVDYKRNFCLLDGNMNIHKVSHSYVIRIMEPSTYFSIVLEHFVVWEISWNRSFDIRCGSQLCLVFVLSR